eukprot:CAMPEP_0206018470 /NCGR_PEP_ID=MMETSP1464-20131121/27191_1 /ASSEMBLY_ACC=CAM_ASM_001124 /TAXON_ID=119497 /ORGANISM="Exanthemachrysis gayraliae, Strain RCC1523" /LENGTH=114 /DNA_ID=CAMNT_0053392347 /DNA_START=192 /DNA_END=537 /DNA_ORIENTATION=-
MAPREPPLTPGRLARALPGGSSPMRRPPTDLCGPCAALDTLSVPMDCSWSSDTWGSCACMGVAHGVAEAHRAICGPEVAGRSSRLPFVRAGHIGGPFTTETQVLALTQCPGQQE